jgi:hypothetical protein
MSFVIFHESENLDQSLFISLSSIQDLGMKRILKIIVDRNSHIS